MPHMRQVFLAALVLTATAACADAPDPQARQSVVPSSTVAVPAPTANAEVVALAPTSDAPSATAPTAVEAPVNPLPAGPLAPDILNEVWLNSPRLTSADLRGHPVLVEFWTFG